MRIIVNDDKVLVKEVREGLKRTGGYCPCRLIQTEDTKCMCKEFREQLERGEASKCYCGLYEIIPD